MRRTASEVLRNLEMRIARLEKQSVRVINLGYNDIDKSFYDGFVEEIHETFERGDGVVFVLVETDEEDYRILRSENGRSNWDNFGKNHRSLSQAESEFEDLVEEFEDW